MPEERRIGSQAPLWRMGSPMIAVRIALPFLLLSLGAVAFVALGHSGTGFSVAAWVFGCFSGIVLIGAAVGFVVMRRISANVRGFAAAEGFTFAVRDRRVTDGWTVAPDNAGDLSRDVVTGTVRGRPLTSFLHQSSVDSGRSRMLPVGAGTGPTLGVRVTILEAGRELPTVELTPRRLSQVEKRTMPAGDPVTVGLPDVEADYHVAADDPAFAAELLSAPVLAGLRDAPQVAVRTCGTRLIALASPMAGVQGIAASVRVLAVLGERLDELPASSPATGPRFQPAYVPPAVQRWQVAPFGVPLAENAMTDVQRGLVGNRPYLTFVHERVAGSGKDQQVHRERVVAVALPAQLPRLEVWPENALRRIAPGLAVREDIDIESDEFNRRYQVAAQNRKYAVDVLNPRAVDALLAVGDFEWRIDGSDLVGICDATTPEAARSHLETLNTVAELIPTHVIADHGWATRPAGPAPTDLTVPPVRAVHVILAILVGLIVAVAGVPIALKVSGDQPGAWMGGMVVVAVITGVAVTLTIVFGRVVDAVRRQREADRHQDSTRRSG